MGLAFAQRFAADGMNVVMSDIEEPALDAAVAEVGGSAVGLVVDVSDADAVDGLRDRALEEFGQVNVVCNNAGVAGGALGGGIELADWQWVMNVNFWGVVNGHRSFLPHLQEHGDGHIVNTASMAGHFPGHSPYSASKWAVVAITEGLYQQLGLTGSSVGVSCLCPGWVDTKIIDSARNRPEWAVATGGEAELTPELEAQRAIIRDLLAGGMPPPEVAGLVVDAILNKKFWIFTDMTMVDSLADHHESIRENRNPEIRMPLS